MATCQENLSALLVVSNGKDFPRKTVGSDGVAKATVYNNRRQDKRQVVETPDFTESSLGNK